MPFELVERVCDLPGGALAGRRQVHDDGAAVGAIDLASQQLPLLEPVEEVGQSRALVTELVVQDRDRDRAVKGHLRQHVRLALGEAELPDGGVEIGADQMRASFQPRYVCTHFVIY